MSKTGTPPATSYPGMSDTFVEFIPAGKFAGAESFGSHRFTSTTEYLEALFVPSTLYAGGRIQFRVLWSVDTGSTADSVTWRIRYAKLTPETTSAETAPTTALTTAIADDTASATASCLQRTASGVLAGATLTDGDVLKLRIDMSSITSLTATTDKIVFYGVEIEYTRKQW